MDYSYLQSETLLFNYELVMRDNEHIIGKLPSQSFDLMMRLESAQLQ